MTDEISELKGRVDLAALVAMDLGPPRRQHGRWWWWLCPFHRETKPSFGVTADTGRFKCFGCGETGDHLDFLQKRRGVTAGEAIEELRRIGEMPEAHHSPQVTPVTGPVEGLPPNPAWQERARAFLAYAQEQLWSGAGMPGLSYLHAGGLADDTIRHFGLGWNPRDLWDDPARWGQGGERIFLARGVVIPCEVGADLWYVKIRRFDAEGHAASEAGQKYGAPRGGRGVLFGADHLIGHGRPLLLCEGERDALLAMQELRHLVDVATLGGAGRRNLGHWVLWLLPYRLILAAYDADAAGQEGAAYLAGLSERVRVVQVPHGHDLTGFHAGGGDLRGWLLEQWKRVQMVAPEQRPAKDTTETTAKRSASCQAVAEGRSR